MTNPAPVLRHPERIHPALWRATQLALPSRPTVPTGFPALDHALPGQGWPVGQLIELLIDRPGCGELQLFRHALAKQWPERSIALVQPPHPPCIQAWVSWQLAAKRLFWVQAASEPDALWATEQILRFNVCAAVFCWAQFLRPASLRRLHLLAQQSDSLCIVLRPTSVRTQASTAVLRVVLQPYRQGVQLHIIKRQGLIDPTPIFLQLYAPPRVPRRHHAALAVPEVA